MLFCGFEKNAIAAFETAEGAAGATVLIYHRFGEEKYPTTNVSVERFRQQLQFLKDNNYKVIPLEQLVAAIGNSSWDRAEAVGDGEEYRAESKRGDHASALTCHDTLVHGSVVAAD